jgi:hypothetical protein
MANTTPAIPLLPPLIQPKFFANPDTFALQKYSNFHQCKGPQVIISTGQNFRQSQQNFWMKIFSRRNFQLQ